MNKPQNLLYSKPSNNVGTEGIYEKEDLNISYNASDISFKA